MVAVYAGAIMAAVYAAARAARRVATFLVVLDALGVYLPFAAHAKLLLGLWQTGGSKVRGHHGGSGSTAFPAEGICGRPEACLPPRASASKTLAICSLGTSLRKSCEIALLET